MENTANGLGARPSWVVQGVMTGTLLLGSTVPLELSARGAITFNDIAAGDASGITYRRAPSDSVAILDSLRAQSVYTLEDLVMTPTKPRGIPGIAVFDYDNDGDRDIYVTNGPGTANSLYVNQLKETGELTFVDRATQAGVDATDQDSAGVCYADIDNDGDKDLYVLGKSEPNRLFENLGDGEFRDITAQAAVGAGNGSSSTCSFGDVNGDGLVDLAVSNLFFGTEQHRLPIVLHGFEDLEQHNQLFVNNGDNQFSDVSLQSGINTDAGISWALALVDYDLDGDLDLVVADDQGARAPAHVGGKDLGKVRLYANNGTGTFREVTERLNGGRFGAWMGLSFGDLNSDGRMDMFASNIGDYMALFMESFVDYPVEVGDWSTGWFLGNENGGFTFDEDTGDLGVIPFGWGSAIVDYDNDGDQDIIYHGGLDMGAFVDASNPGAVLRNDGYGSFSRDIAALAYSTNHSRRNVNGVAVADLNNDGFVDIASVSNFNWPDQAPLAPYFSDPAQLVGGAFDEVAYFMPNFTPLEPGNPAAGFTWNGVEEPDGTLSVEINSGGNGNFSAQIELMGTRGLTTSGKVNRDGIGAVAQFKPRRGSLAMKPVVSGGTYASQHDTQLTFGMKRSRRATLDVLWPGGVRNRLYNVRAGEKIVVPEIPCSYDDTSVKKRAYRTCVSTHLRELVAQGVLNRKQSRRLQRSAIRAYGAETLNGDEDNGIRFEDDSERVASFTHLTTDTEGLSGAAWFDYDGDLDLDLFLTNGVGHDNALFRNDGRDGFTEVGAEAGIQNGGGNSGVLAGDIDNDGYPDLFLSSDGGMVTPVEPSEFRLYHNNADGTFTDITASSGIDGLITSFSSAFGDVNGDGYVDLLVSTPGSIPMQRQDRNKLFLNNGDLTFTDISAQTGIDTALGGCLAAFSDYDLDGDQDILIGNCNDIRFIPGPIELFRNEGNLAFTNVTQQAGLLRQGAWMGFAIADYDNDGDQDIFSTNLGSLPGLFPAETTGTVLYENNGDGTFTDVDEAAGVHQQIWGWGATFADFDNDGHSDLFTAGSFPFNLLPSTSNPGTLFINSGDTTFTNRSAWLGVDLSDRFTSGVAAGDYNKDGFSDLIVASGAMSVDGDLASERLPAHPVLLTNGGNSAKAITLNLVGTQSNRDALGARIVVQTGAVVQTKEVRAGSSFLSTESRWLTFGVGDRETVDSIMVHWPSGLDETFESIESGQFLTIVEGEGIVHRESLERRNNEEASDDHGRGKGKYRYRHAAYRW